MFAKTSWRMSRESDLEMLGLMWAGLSLPGPEASPTTPIPESKPVVASPAPRRAISTALTGPASGQEDLAPAGAQESLGARPGWDSGSDARPRTCSVILRSDSPPRPGPSLSVGGKGCSQQRPACRLVEKNGGEKPFVQRVLWTPALLCGHRSSGRGDAARSPLCVAVTTGSLCTFLPP